MLIPQPDSIVQLTPMARAPAGSVFATAFKPRLTTAASRSRIDGSTEQITTQEEAMLAVAAAPTSRACGHDIAPMLGPYAAVRRETRESEPEYCRDDSGRNRGAKNRPAGPRPGGRWLPHGTAARAGLRGGEPPWGPNSN